jgi:hypothetical protein
VIPQGENVTITFEAIAPASPSVTNWITEATAGIEGGGVTLTLQGEQPIVTVNPPQYNPPIISASPGTINKYQTSTLSQFTGTSGGTPPYTYQWLEAFNGGTYFPITGANEPEYIFSPTTLTSTGTWSFQLKVTDSSFVPLTITSNTVNVVVNSALEPPEVTATPNVVTQSQPSTLESSRITTGTSPYTYKWFQEAPGEDYKIVGGNTPSYIFPGSTTAGTWTFFTQVTDSTGESVNSSVVDITITSIPVFTITVIQTAHGTINPETVIVDLGNDQSFTISADSDYYVADVLVDGISVGAITDYSFKSVTTNHSITANFVANSSINSGTNSSTNFVTNSGTYFINVISTHGSPTPSTQVNSGESFFASVTSPERDTNQRWICTGYSVDSDTLVSGTSHTFSNVQADHTITFNWQTQYLVTLSQNGIDSNASGPILNVLNNTITYEELPFSVWINAGEPITFSYVKTIENTEAGKQYILESSNSTSPIMINGPTTIQGNYQSKIISSGFTLNTIALAAISLIVPPSLIIVIVVKRRKGKKKIKLITNKGGTISPNTVQTIEPGNDSTVFIITADPGYKIADVVIDKTIHLGPIRTYKFVNVTQNHTISAIFSKNETQKII